MLTFKEYSEFARLSDMYPRVTGVGGQILPVYPALALMGESGELAEKIAGHRLQQVEYLNEIGDMLWYIDAAARDLGLELDRVSSSLTFGSFARMVNSADDDHEDIVTLRCVSMCSKFSEYIKKAWRDQHIAPVENCRLYLQDALASLHQVSTCVYSDLESAARANMAKLASRRARGVVSGSGDNR